MTLLDFRMFLALVYLPITDNLPFSLLFFIFVCLFIYVLLDMSCIWISGTFVASPPIPVTVFILVSDGKGERRAELCSHVELSFSKQASHPESLWPLSPALSCGSSLCLERLERDEAMVLRRILWQSPGRFIHKSSLVLSSLSLNLVSSLVVDFIIVVL